MKFFHNKESSGFFGDARHGFEPVFYKNTLPHESVVRQPFADMISNFSSVALYCAHQVHGAQGIALSSLDQLALVPLFSQEGDFVITSVPHLMIAVVTADCLSVLIEDSVKKIVGAAHAGWRGSVAGVLASMINAMKEQYGSRLEDMTFRFGPCAHVCCYEVDEVFRQSVRHISEANQSFKIVGSKLYFDLPGFNKRLLCKEGVAESAIDMTDCACTICNKNFCSYRRDQSGMRQISGISLK